MSTISMAFGELTLAFTTAYEFRWSDRKSDGGSKNCGFWQPVPPTGFHALGGIGITSNKTDPNGKVAALCVSGEIGDGLGNAGQPLAYPVKFTRIWKDKGTGGKHSGSCWRPVPRSGYRAMGDVFVSGHDTAPDLASVVCVRQDLAHLATAGDLVWDDKGTGAKKDFGAWQVVPAANFTEATIGLIAANTFVGLPTRTKPTTELDLYVLMLPLPVEVLEDADPPTLDSRSAPALQTSAVIDRRVYVPFTAIKDSGRSVQWKVDNSPFYTIQRQASYDLVIYEDNRTSEPQEKVETLTVGVSETETEEYSVTTGMEVSYTAGVSFVAESSVSMSISTELGFSTSTSVEEFSERSVARGLVIPADTAAALWVVKYTLQALRADGRAVSDAMPIQVEAFYSSQYPPVAASGAEEVQVVSLNGLTFDLDPARILPAARV